MIRVSKIIIFVNVFLFMGVSIFAQIQRVQNDPTYDYKKLHFGFTIGFNTMDFSIAQNSSNYQTDKLFADVVDLFPGFHVGIVSSLRLTNYLNLRLLPGISFGQRNLSYITETGGVDHVMKIPSTYLEVPLLVKYRAARINNFRPYIITGLNFRWDMASNKQFNEEEEIYVRLSRYDLYYEFGIGIDNFLQYFKFSTELKFSIGLNDVMVHKSHEYNPQYANAISQMTSFLVMLSFHFE